MHVIDIHIIGFHTFAMSAVNNTKTHLTFVQKDIPRGECNEICCNWDVLTEMILYVDVGNENELKWDKVEM